MLLYVTLIIVVILLFASAYFSACETSVSIASKAKLHSLWKNGSKKAKLAEQLKDQIGIVISAILTCNTIFNAIGTSIAAGICFKLVGEPYASLLTSFLMGGLILIYGEVLPKMIAINNPEKLLIQSAYMMKIFLIICKPISKITNKIAVFTMRYILKIKPPESNKFDSIEELRGIIDLHKDQGDGQERAMLKSVLDLSSVQISDIMVHRKNVTMINAEDPIESIVDQVLSSPFTRLPLWQGNLDNIIGVINVKMLVRSVRTDPNRINHLDIKDIANTPWFIPDSTDLLEQLQMFRKRREHFALVVDEYGAFMGVVTLEDILEEIVGQIDDEHDISVTGVRPQTDNSFIIDGSITLRDLNRQFDWSLPDDSAATIAGLLINTVRMIPNEGQVFMLYGFRLTVVKKQGNQITRIKIAKCE